MRAMVTVAIVAAAAPAAAERRGPIDACVIAIGAWDDHRLEVAPLVGTSLGGGAWRHDAIGGAARYTLTEHLVIGVEARRFHARPRDGAAMLPGAPGRAGAASLELGYRLGIGKLLSKWDHLTRFDVVASIGPAVVETSGGPARAAIAVGAAVRLFLLDWLTLDLGLRDDILVGGERAIAARMVGAPVDRALPAHAVEVRAGLGIWWPLRPAPRCRVICR
jgi:hypothetical protein